jgi:hypothetical protein
LNTGGRILVNVFDIGVTAVSLNITHHPTAGIGEWSDEEIKRAIVEGVSRELAKVRAFPYYKNISDEDMNAMIAYLRSVPPMPGLE